MRYPTLTLIALITATGASADTLPISVVDIAYETAGVSPSVAVPADTAGRLFYDPDGAAIAAHNADEISGLFKHVQADARYAAFWSFEIAAATRDMQDAMISSEGDWDWTWIDLRIRNRAGTDKNAFTTARVVDAHSGLLSEIDGIWADTGSAWVYRDLDMNSGKGVFAIVTDSILGLHGGPIAHNNWIDSQGGTGTLSFTPSLGSPIPLPTSTVLALAGMGALATMRRRGV